MFRRASVLLVAAAFALGGCSRQAADAPAARAAAAGPVAVASVGDAGTPAAAGDPAAPASAGPAADEGGSAEAAWNALAAAATPAAAGKGPFLWRVEGRAPLYLFGTIHVPDDRVLALPPSVVKAFGEASAVYTEIPMDSATQMGIMGKVMLPDGTQLSDVIGQPLYDRMTAAARKTLGGEHAAMGAMLGPLFQRMKPWAAMSQLSLLEFLPDMMAGKQPLDSMLYAKAQSDGKKVGALETPDEQIAVFESFTTREQIRMLELTLDEIERVKPGEPDPDAGADRRLPVRRHGRRVAGDGGRHVRRSGADGPLPGHRHHPPQQPHDRADPGAAPGAAVDGVLRRRRHGPLRRPDRHRGPAPEGRPEGLPRA